MFETKVVEKIKIHILCSITFFRKSCRLGDNVEKYGGAREATDDNIIQRMQVKNTHLKCIINTLFFHDDNGYVNAPHCYVVRAAPVFL